MSKKGANLFVELLYGISSLFIFIFLFFFEFIPVTIGLTIFLFAMGFAYDIASTPKKADEDSMIKLEKRINDLDTRVDRIRSPSHE